MLELIPPEAALYLSAELLFLIVRSGDILIMLKRQSQRTEKEQQRVTRGLMRSVGLEVVLFVPASATLVMLLAPLVTPDKVNDGTYPKTAYYALLGIVSYGFPFAVLRRFVTRVALKTLQEFATITEPEKK